MKPIEEMTIQEIKDELEYLREKVQRKEVLFGYEVKQLEATAIILQEKDITPDMLSNSMKMYLKGYNDGQKAIAEVFAKTKETLCGSGEGGKQNERQN